MLDLIEQTIVD